MALGRFIKKDVISVSKKIKKLTARKYRIKIVNAQSKIIIHYCWRHLAEHKLNTILSVVFENLLELKHKSTTFL